MRANRDAEFGTEEVIDVEEGAVDVAEGSVEDNTADVAQGSVSEKELEARAKKEARAKEWADNKTLIRARKDEMYAVLQANGFDTEYTDGLQKIIGEEHVTRAKKVSTPRLALRDLFVGMFEGVIGKVVKGMDIFTDATTPLGGIGKDKLNILCADAIRKASTPAERQWITAIPDETFPMVNNYTLVAVGENAPEGWDGFLPTETL